MEEKLIFLNEANGDSVVSNPSTRLLDTVLAAAFPMRATDIHIEPCADKVAVRYRVDGALRRAYEFPKAEYPPVCSRLKVLSNINIAEHRIPQDGRISCKYGGAEYDLRVSTLPTVHGEKFAVRVLDKTPFRLTRAELGFLPEENKTVDRFLSAAHGIVLLTGPTGCGKSTTLYSFLREINEESVNVITVEDPVEYTLDGVSQVQINPKAGLTFANVLRSIVRQDPDVIMVGEIRDEETAAIAVRAAVTGHLVFSTLHTNDAAGAITRLVDMKVPPYLVADAVSGVIAQRLVRRLCPDCRKRERATEEERALLGLEQGAEIYRACGCGRCSGSGYVGRVAVHEIMPVDDRIRTAVAAGVSAVGLGKIAREEGMVTLKERCRRLVAEGVTDLSSVIGFLAD